MPLSNLLSQDIQLQILMDWMKSYMEDHNTSNMEQTSIFQQQAFPATCLNSKMKGIINGVWHHETRLDSMLAKLKVTDRMRNFLQVKPYEFSNTVRRMSANLD